MWLPKGRGVACARICSFQALSILHSTASQVLVVQAAPQRLYHCADKEPPGKLHTRPFSCFLMSRATLLVKSSSLTVDYPGRKFVCPDCLKYVAMTVFS